jgi:hypothetical protein
MKWQETILQRLDDWRPSEGRSTLDIEDKDTGRALRVTADRNDELGTLAWEVSLKRPLQASESVRSWAERCAERVTGLDPLALLEVDGSRDEAMLRSSKPTRRGDSQYYYELMLKGTSEAKLRRYQATGTQRSQVAFPITHEALGRVVEGLSTE